MDREFDKFAEVASRQIWGLPPAAKLPSVTIAIPTFNRSNLLIEALISACEQDYGGTFEIVILDNASEEVHRSTTLNWLENRKDSRVRYFVNDRNIGMFGNWNRCIALGKNRWVTILNDDDLLDRDFLSQSMRALERYPNCKAIVCDKRILDERPRPTQTSGSRNGSLSSAITWKIKEMAFDRILRARYYFWGSISGNCVGQIFDRECAKAIGGFRAEDAPSADYAFNVRMAIGYEFRQLFRTLATIRVGENESMKHETLKGFLLQDDRIRRDLLKNHVPAEWMAYRPMITARQIWQTQKDWGVTIDPRQLEDELGFTVPVYKEKIFSRRRLRARISNAIPSLLAGRKQRHAQ